ncbi:hypothetical protein CAPTEDRAFT_216344 [Capitella teleta]|uniref:BTB domain-containing protein n=1 Tax=Capitella teleta TaxID=283909 RepID=R7VH17_CAPTE|nr:hypothetical protein CAPTEDRAFT_216344 [Capitella teleta]|eukprot:ELU17862.1 hypothetical protein CAPTEDRAFT_216344 [Capitella teleta]
MTQEITSLPAIFSQMREAGEFVDITLVFDEQRVLCHKVILAGTCDYFHRMFLSDMLESTAKEVTMKEISASTGVSLVHFLYTGRIKITTQNAKDLLAASEMLLIGSLKPKVEEFLRSNTELVNCISSISLARQYDMKTLMEDAKKFLHERVREVTDSEEMHLLLEEDLIEALNANASQENNFCLLQKWILSADGRTDRFDDLIQHISLSNCSKKFICSTVMSENLMHNTHGMELIQEAMQSPRTTDPLEQQSLVVGNLEGEMWLCTDAHVHHWQPMEKPPVQCLQYSACASPGGFVVSGGKCNGNACPNCYSYDAHENKWNALPPMSTARVNHSSIYHDRHLYIVGGLSNEGHILDSIEALDMRSLKWSNLPPLPRAAYHSYLAVVSNKLLVFSGIQERFWLADVNEFDLNERVWQQKAPMPELCVGGAAVCLDDHVYIVGGGNRTCSQFNPSRNIWTSLQRPQFARYFGPALVWNQSIVIFGGKGKDSIEKYSPLTDTWTTWALKMPKEDCWRFVVRMNNL